MEKFTLSNDGEPDVRFKPISSDLAAYREAE